MNVNLLEVKSAKITEKGQVSIPKNLRSASGFKTGAKVAILVYSDRMELRPMSRLNDAMYASLMSEKALAKSWRSKKEEEAWKGL